MHRRSSILLTVLAAALVVGACSSGDHPGALATTTSTRQPTTTTGARPDLGAARAVFVDLVGSYCDTTSVPDPLKATFGAHGSLVEVTDVTGDHLLLDPDARLVTSLEGKGGLLPSAYSFFCSPDVFQGTLDH